jgi:pimeloyl-ACP methyl ester carboxylesterase
MSVAAQTLSPPSRTLMFLEGRAISELGAFLGALPLLSLAPRGDGHPVLVLPGLVASDTSTRPLRSFLKGRGYAVSGWRQGRNLGLRHGVQNAMVDLVQELNDTHGRKVSLVGWSLGGLYARQLAKMMPERVRSVITLGSPFTNDITATNATRLYEALSGEGINDNPEIREAIAGDLPVPTTSIYSRTDGIVNWHTSLLRPSDTAENIEVHLASHIGLGVNPAALWAVADRLAQGEGEFKQFDRSGPFAIAYGPPENAQS